MSHDQKPGKMRVVGNGSQSPQRRRGDVAQAAVASVAATSADVPALAGAALPSAAGSKSPMLLIILFLVGCAIGGAALPLLHTF